MLRIEVITLFPQIIDVPVGESILGKAADRGLLQVRTRELRPYGLGKHHITDDTPYGGGAGMVMKPEPVVAAIEDSRKELEAEGQGPARVILMDPQGTVFDQAQARRLAEYDSLVLVCGRYEGIDDRVREYVDESISLGDFVLTGGEPAALCIIDAVARLRPGVLGNDDSSELESFDDGLLEGPQYTRPMKFRGARVPEVLVSGAHARVRRWRRQQALVRTREHRPDLWAAFTPTDEDRELLREFDEAGDALGRRTGENG